MRRRPLLWLILSVLCFVAAFYFWRLGDQLAAKKAAGRPADATNQNRSSQPVHSQAAPFQLLTDSVMLSPLQHSNTPSLHSTNRFAYRLSNTTKTPGQLLDNNKAILLENALLDTEKGTSLPIPANLRAKGEPGSYIVQSTGPINDNFRLLLTAAGAAIVSYVPNNAYLVRASAEVAQVLGSQNGVQNVLPYEPYYKLKSSLLKMAVEQTPLPEGTSLNLLAFSDTGESVKADLAAMGVQVLGEDSSPFGPVFRVRPTPGSLASLASLPGIQELELAHYRVPANDMSRLNIKAAANTVTSSNYLGLTGAGIMVNVNDSGIDSTHPDLTGRVFGDALSSGFDTNGHGTHVAGIIASSGGQSSTVTNASSEFGPYAGTNSQFRGLATNATLFSLAADPDFGPFYSDSYLQQTAAKTNAFISNNSWNYSDLPQYKSDVASYDLAAASYDAAVRDALPFVSGPQPLLFVFAAGDAGFGDDTGGTGIADSILSPATAKNVITVGAVENPRFMTNEVAYDVFDGLTNAVWLGGTDSSNQVASYSSRGNVGVGTEGDFGRFKPDVVAPGSFVISTRSGQWDQNAYYTSHDFQHFVEIFLDAGQRVSGSFNIPTNTVRVDVRLNNRRSPLPFPDMPIYVQQFPVPSPTNFTYTGTNLVRFLNPTPFDTNWYFTVQNVSAQQVVFDVIADVMVSDPNDQTFLTLSNVNNSLGGNAYRYESGTSMSAAAASGTLALMQQFLRDESTHRTNGWGGPEGRSPALMKAMLINGARSLPDYDFLVNNDAVNFQGWGLMQLPSSIHGGLANETAPQNSMFLVDQDPTNALASGQSQTFNISVQPPARASRLRITLAWTDPPANPIVSTKLVNDLDLIVTNIDTVGTGTIDVFFGNDILGGNDSNLPWNTNQVPNIDRVNNVENVYIPPPLASNYSITISAHRVNVNAVALNPTGVVQDYALVVSCGDGQITNALTMTPPTQPANSGITPLFLTVLTNAFPDSTNYFGQTLTRQHAGANSPLQGTNLVTLPGAAGAQLTIGVTNQWQFYAITNTSGFTNARFAIFSPRELSAPRMGVDALIDTNATRPFPEPGADVDLYVSTDPTLLNLNPNAISNALKDIGRNGGSTIVISNAQNIPYFAAVKSEDQMAAEFTFQALFSLLPFGQGDQNGLLLSWLDDSAIPDGSPQKPGVTNIMLGPGDPSVLVKRVVVSNLLDHELMGDLVGGLSYADGTFAVLNNHAPLGSVSNWFIYDDSTSPVPGSQRSAGPGSLHDFAGRHLGDMFTFFEEDNALQHIGTNRSVFVFLEKQLPLTNGVTVTILPGQCDEEFIEVPANAVSMTIFATLQPPSQPAGAGPVSMQVCQLAAGGMCSSNVNVGSGNTITLNQFTTPPLLPGTYVVRLCNQGTLPVTVFVIASFKFQTVQTPSILFTTNPMTPILDDAVSYAYFNVTNHFTISSLHTAFLIDHLRASDLAVTLISPTGKRVLLYEDRGGTSTSVIGASGTFTNSLGVPISFTTNLVAIWTNNFDDVPTGPYTPGAVFDGWNVVTNYVDVYPELPAPWLSNNILVLANGIVSNNLPTTNASGYTLSFKVTHAPWLVGTVAWWPLDKDASDIFGGLNGLLEGDVHFSPGKVNNAFIGDGIGTMMKVPRCPALTVGGRGGFSIEGWLYPTNIATTNPPPVTNGVAMSDGFENAPDTPVVFPAGSYVSGWYVESGDVNISYPGSGFFGLPDSGRHCLDLNGDQPGAISTNFVTVPGTSYMLTLAYCKNPSPAEPPGFTALADILITGQSTYHLSYSAANDYNNLNWSHTSIVFKATSPLTQLRFNSMNAGDGGMYLDTIQVNAVTIPDLGSPLAEWQDATATNGVQQGVQFWLSGVTGTNVLGALCANIWDTNFAPHIVTTVTNAITNAGWQHVALTYDAPTRIARLYTNGLLATAQVVSATNMVPLTPGDFYLGFHPATSPRFVSFGGGLDEFGLYERPLSDCEVLAICRAGPLGKYGTNVLWCPLTNSAAGTTLDVQLNTSNGPFIYSFTNGLGWPTNGVGWETNMIFFTNQLFSAITNGPGTNLTGLIVSPHDPNIAVDDFILSELDTNFNDGMMHFTENTNVALLPIKFAPTPYSLSNIPPTLVFSNDFENATSRVYQVGEQLLGTTNNPPQQVFWTVIGAPVTVISNSLVAAAGTNAVALANGGLLCNLPTVPGQRYQLSFTVRGPAAVSWWNGAVEPLSRRAWDLLGGNHGAFIDTATNFSPGFVGLNAFFFNGQDEPAPANDPDIFFEDIDDTASSIQLGDPANLRLTNAFTIEGWFNPIVQTNLAFCGTELILFRGYPDAFDCSGLGDPYWLSLEPAIDPFHRDIHFHISDAHSGTLGADVITSNAPVVLGGGPNNGWWHVAAVFDKPYTNFTIVTNGTNIITITTNAMRLYLNGQCIATNYTTISPFQNLDPSLTGGVAIGCRSRYDTSEAYRGFMDELTVYGRALTAPEITNIFTVGQAGKADTNAPTAAQSLAQVSVSVDGQQRDLAYGDNAHWTMRTFEFTAVNTNSVLTLQSLLPGTLVDGITLTTVPAQLSYLPEESLASLDGTDAYGTWTLEMWDTRAGGTSSSNLNQLLTWQLQFQMLPIAPPPIVYLQYGIPYTNSLTPNGIQYFVVDVPQWATMATNALLFSEQYNTTNLLPVGVLFDTNQFPNSSATQGLLWPPVTSGISTLTTNSTPSIIIGQPYYLAVTNTNSVSVTFAVEVWFDIISLTNCAPLSNYVAQAGIPRYFQFTVPTNSLATNTPAQEVSIYLTGVGTNAVGWHSNVTVVVSEHLPLPDLTHFDYASFNPRTNDDIVFVVTNSTPWSVQTNTWYVGVWSSAPTNVAFSVQACYSTNYPQIILLTNGVPFVAPTPISQYAAPPGPPQNLFFEFSITNFVDGVLFELYNLSGNADLVLQRDLPPGMAPYSAGSFRIASTNDQIVLRTSPDLADLRGNWYLGVYNKETNNVAYTIRAVVEANGMLPTAVPLSDHLLLKGGLPWLVEWSSVVGEYYTIRGANSVLGPWFDLDLVQATTPITTYLIHGVGLTFSYFNVVQISDFFVPHPPLSIQLWPTNMIRLSWPDSFPNETVQYSTTPIGPWANLNHPINHEGNQFAEYDTIGPVPRYYRLIP